MDEPISTKELLLRLQGRDLAAVDGLYSRYFVRFYWYARRKGLSHEDAEDCVEIAFIDKIIPRIHQFDPTRGNGESWLQRIMTNVVLERIREMGRERSRLVRRSEDGDEDDMGVVDSDAIDPEQWVAENEEYRIVAEALARLSEEDREELRRYGRGDGRTKWHKAKDRLRAKIEESRDVARANP